MFKSKPITGSFLSAAIVISASLMSSSALAADNDQDRATIDEMTELARKAKIGEFKKSIAQTNAAIEDANRGAARANEAPAVQPVVAATPVEPPKPQLKELEPPVVAGLWGVGKKMFANDSMGRPLLAGEQVDGWRVDSVGMDGVTFSRCESGKGKRKPECVTKLSSPAH